MTAQELVDKLQDFIDAYGPDKEVRIAEQPSYPFEYSIRGCTDSMELGFEEEDLAAFEEDGIIPDGPEKVFYIVEGSQLGYFRKDAWDACH